MDGATLDIVAATRGVVARLLDGLALADCTIATVARRLDGASADPPSVVDALADFLVRHVSDRVKDSDGDPAVALLELSKISDVLRNVSKLSASDVRAQSVAPLKRKRDGDEVDDAPGARARAALGLSASEKSAGADDAFGDRGRKGSRAELLGDHKRPGADATPRAVAFDPATGALVSLFFTYPNGTYNHAIDFDARTITYAFLANAKERAKLLTELRKRPTTVVVHVALTDLTAALYRVRCTLESVDESAGVCVLSFGEENATVEEPVV